MDDTGFAVLLRKVTDENDAYNFYEHSRRDLDWGNFSSDDLVLHRSFGLSSYIQILRKQYQNLNITDQDLLALDDSDVKNQPNCQSNSIENGKEKKNKSGYNKIYSIYGNRLGSDMKRELQKLYSLLGNGGDAAIIFLLESTYFYFLHELYEHSVWGAYMKYKAKDIPQWLIWKQDKAKYYKRVLKEIGFSIVDFRTRSHFKTFSSDEECKDWICSTIAFSGNLEEHMKIKFREEAFNIFLKYNKRMHDGCPSLYINNLIALVKKFETSITTKNADYLRKASSKFSSSFDYQSSCLKENSCTPLTVKGAYFSETNESSILHTNSSYSSDNLSNEKNILFRTPPVYPFLRTSPVSLDPPSVLLSKYLPNQQVELLKSRGISEEDKRQSQKEPSVKTSYQNEIQSLHSPPSIGQTQYLTVERIPQLNSIQPTYTPPVRLLNSPVEQLSHFSERQTMHLPERKSLHLPMGEEVPQPVKQTSPSSPIKYLRHIVKKRLSFSDSVEGIKVTFDLGFRKNFASASKKMFMSSFETIVHFLVLETTSFLML